MLRIPRVLVVLLALILGGAGLVTPVPAQALDAAAFIEKTYRWAQSEEREHGVPASVSLAQSMLESGMGESRLTRDANNWFGIKCSSTTSPYQSGCYSISTTEYDSNGNPYTTTARFRAYDDPEKSFIDHGYFLSRLSRYAAAFEHSDNPDRFIFEVHLGGYATDPQYANKVINLMTRHNLYQYNLTPPAEGPSELVVRPQTKAFTGAAAAVTGLLSPQGAGRELLVQASTSSGWVTTHTAVAGGRGQFSLPLDHAMNDLGTVTYRVLAKASSGVLETAPFHLERIGRVTVQQVPAVMTTQSARLLGKAAGYAGRPVTSQVLVDKAWQDHSTSVVGADGTFELPLTHGRTAGAGSWSVRAVVTDSSGKKHDSNVVTATWVDDIYTTPGEHEFNGRLWRTECEAYSSSTERCRTEIWASTVKQVDGRFVKTNAWTFNNLTYLPSPRWQWSSNPLGGFGQRGYDSEWTSDGRQWRTECDTAVTGSGGCRASILADVIVAKQQASGSWQYSWERKWVFNNIVRFS